MKLDEKTEVTLDLKTIGLVIGFVATTVGAKRLPEPVVTRTEYDLKDKLIRETIMNTQEKVEENGEKLDLIEERLYEISTTAKRK